MILYKLYYLEMHLDIITELCDIITELLDIFFIILTNYSQNYTVLLIFHEIIDIYIYIKNVYVQI